MVSHRENYRPDDFSGPTDKKHSAESHRRGDEEVT
jgi:hypothetical protein